MERPSIQELKPNQTLPDLTIFPVYCSMEVVPLIFLPTIYQKLTKTGPLGLENN